MKLNLDSLRIEMPCKACGSKHATTVGEMKREKQFTCHCGTVTHVDPSEFERGVAEAQKSLDDLKKTLGRLGKK